MKTIDAEIADVDSLLTSMTQPQGKTFWSEGPRVSERLGALANGIDGPNRAPTPHQVQLLGELQVEWKEALAKVAAKLGKIISQAEPLHNVSPVAVAPTSTRPPATAPDRTPR